MNINKLKFIIEELIQKEIKQLLFCNNYLRKNINHFSSSQKKHGFPKFKSEM